MAKRRRTSRTPWWVIWAVFAASVGVWLAWGVWGAAYLTSRLYPERSLEGHAQFGDLFGGINALFTALAFAAVWWTGRMQREELELQRNELENTREVFQRQSFESTFFQQLRLFRDVSDAFTWNQTKGSEAIQAAGSYFKRIASGSRAAPEVLQSLDRRRRYIAGSYEDSYRNLESQFGPLFRTLYHLFKLIDRQDYMKESEKVYYANLARAQLSADHLILLSANCLSAHGEGFVPLVEKYGLLKHLPRRDGLECMESFYAPRAFQSEEERAAAL